MILQHWTYSADVEKVYHPLVTTTLIRLREHGDVVAGNELGPLWRVPRHVHHCQPGGGVLTPGIVYGSWGELGWHLIICRMKGNDNVYISERASFNPLDMPFKVEQQYFLYHSQGIIPSDSDTQECFSTQSIDKDWIRLWIWFICWISWVFHCYLHSLPVGLQLNEGGRGSALKSDHRWILQEIKTLIWTTLTLSVEQKQMTARN